MLATLVIGLREGLEAALIVGIVAAFLRRSGHSLRPMWCGVAAAVLLSVAVGVALELVSAELPQAQQEGMEAVIGAVAVVFVTSMVFWMSTHARGMRRALEESASAALSRGTAWALAGMAFLAVLKEGFETSVFLLATFQSATDTGLAALGAVIGIAIAAAIGVGLYHGGVRLDLGRFFRVTGVFLVLVAAGLVVSALRAAHEAGWVTIGQQRILDLSWLAPPGSVQAALVTGVLGMPRDPRLVEVLGWLLYVVPVLALTLWPRRLKPDPAAVPALRLAAAGVLALAALALTVAVPGGTGAPASRAAPLAGGGSARLLDDGTSLAVERDGERATVSFRGARRDTVEHAGVEAERLAVGERDEPAGMPRSLSLGDLLELEGGRLPVGISARANPGPFAATWSEHVDRFLWRTGSGALLDASSDATLVVTLSGGGLPAARTLTVADPADASWRLAPSSVRDAALLDARAGQDARELLLWRLWLPLALGVVAAILALRGLRERAARRSPRTLPADPATAAPSAAAPTAAPSAAASSTASSTASRSTHYAAE